MAVSEYIHVVASTSQPIPRGSQFSPYEFLQDAIAVDYNATNGANDNRAFLLIDRREDPLLADPVLEQLVMPVTAGFQSEFDDITGPTNKDYQGQPSAPAPGPATWIVERQVQPQTLEGAKEQAHFLRAEKYSTAVEPGWPYPLPSGNSRRIPFTSEFILGLYQSCAQVAFAESRGVTTAQRIPIRTDIGNFDRPKAEVYDNVAEAINALGEFSLLDINLEQAIRNAETPQECRDALDATVYPAI